MDNNKFEQNMNEIFDLEEPLVNIPKNIQEITTETVQVNKVNDLDKDYDTVRSNLQDIISRGSEAIDGILMVANESQNPRAYEVVSQLIKSVSEANKELIALHKEMKEIKKDVVRGPSTVNNSIFVGSTKELQQLIKSQKKELLELEHDGEVINE
jgi:hypothetical protein